MTKKYDMLKVHRLAFKMDIGNADPSHLYDVGACVINVWCTPATHPGNEWSAYIDRMTAGAYAKPAEFVGEIMWDWNDEIEQLEISTSPYFLSESTGRSMEHFKNRPEEIEFVKEKIRILFTLARVECPTFVIVAP